MIKVLYQVTEHGLNTRTVVKKPGFLHTWLFSDKRGPIAVLFDAENKSAHAIAFGEVFLAEDESKPEIPKKAK